MAQSFIPALRYHALTPLYDAVVRLTSRESGFKHRLLERLELSGTERVLDLGCGTGTFALLVKQHHPQAEVTGVDADQAMLSKARAQAGGALRFERALAQQLPYNEGAFDVVASSLFFHHLQRQDKLAVMREARRVLCPGGRMLIADWGKPGNALLRASFYLVQSLDGFPNTEDNVRGLLPEFLRQAGFEDVAITDRMAAPLGTIELYRARKSG